MEQPLTIEDVNRILRRAGVKDFSARRVFELVRISDDVPLSHDDARCLRQVVRLLLADSVVEDARWTARVKRVERRIDFAVDALRGGHDDDLG